MNARVPYRWADRQPWLELALPIAEYRGRITQIQNTLNREEIDALLIWEDADRASNIQYLSGFDMIWGTSVVVVHRSRGPVLVTNAVAHGEPMHSNVQTAWIEDMRVSFSGGGRGLLDHVTKLFAEWGLSSGRLAVADLDHLPYGVARAMPDIWPRLEILPGEGILREMRRRKSPAEIEIIRRSAIITSAGMDAALDAAIVGATEADVAAAAHRGCLAAGAERMSFGCFTAAGRRGGLKNVFGRADKAIAGGELVVIDLGCKYRGYQSDMSRNAVTDPAPEMVALLEACLAAQEAALAYIKPGVTTASVVAAMKDVTASRGYAEWDWSLCHGFGLDLTEDPYFQAAHPQIVETGMCFYIEPIIADLSFGCACIEDMVVVTEDGCEQLTTSRKIQW